MIVIWSELYVAGRLPIEILDKLGERLLCLPGFLAQAAVSCPRDPCGDADFVGGVLTWHLEEMVTYTGAEFKKIL